MQHDAGTADLHFALGNLFRRRGEYERAVRVHEHLLNRGDLPAAERDRAQHELAQDFMKAGLLDRAERAYEALDGTAFDTEARLALLTLHERSRDWRAAAEVAARLEKAGAGSFASRIAHYWCELSLEAAARQQPAEADDALARAREAAPQAARPLILAGQRALAQGNATDALRLWGALLVSHPAAFNLVAPEFAKAAQAAGDRKAALDQLDALYRRHPTSDLLDAIGTLDDDPKHQRRRLLEHLQQQPTLSAAEALLARDAGAAPDDAEREGIRAAISRAAKPLRRYRCAACGFEAQHYFWQCPGCLNWDSYPPQRLEDLG
jgi:lipopolysaccharide biosynthesis regulator YciM